MEKLSNHGKERRQTIGIERICLQQLYTVGDKGSRSLLSLSFILFPLHQQETWIFEFELQSMAFLSLCYPDNKKHITCVCVWGERPTIHCVFRTANVKLCWLGWLSRQSSLSTQLTNLKHWWRYTCNNWYFRATLGAADTSWEYNIDISSLLMVTCPIFTLF